MKSKFLVACLAVSILSSQALIAGEGSTPPFRLLVDTVGGCSLMTPSICASVEIQRGTCCALDSEHDAAVLPS
jgi:hypothetical protein